MHLLGFNQLYGPAYKQHTRSIYRIVSGVLVYITEASNKPRPGGITRSGLYLIGQSMLLFYGAT
jgi:hypothetical protein